MMGFNRKDLNCLFCDRNIETTSSEDGAHKLYKCPYCGNYVINYYSKDKIKYKNEIATYLFYNKYESEIFIFIGDVEDFKRINQYDFTCEYLSEETIKAFYPKSFSERIDRILLELSKRSKYMGDKISISLEDFYRICFLKIFNDKEEFYNKDNLDPQLKYFIDHLVNSKYVSFPPTNDGQMYHNISILSDGWKRIDEIEKRNNNNKDVFVSMAFNKGTEKTREAIKTGIMDSGYSPEFLDEIIHNQQIVPEMLRLIRECRFLILEITDPNYGAYYEAGYALGLGKEVIICCSEEIFNKKYETEEEQKYQKYLKPHFDIAQKQILVWKDHEDLTHKLTEWIRSIIG